MPAPFGYCYGCRRVAVYSENGPKVDFAAVDTQLRNADVYVIGFSWFGVRLLIDTRTAADDGPIVEIVEPTGTVQERYRWIAGRRPAFGPPQNFAFWVWPHSVTYLRTSEVIEAVHRTLDSWPEALEALDDCLDILSSAHTEAMREAIRGDGAWRTLWERKTI